MVETNKVFRGSDQFNAVSQQFLMDNASRFAKISEIEYRLFLPFLSDLAPGKPTCINANVQRYRDCLIRLSIGKSTANIIILDQFDQELYRELGSLTSWVRDLYKAINNTKYGEVGTARTGS